MKVPSYKNKKYNDLTKEAQIAFIERVCMDNAEYFNEVLGRGSKEAIFINQWKDKVLKLEVPSSSSRMDHYIYSEDKGLCVVDKESSILSLKFNIQEILVFICNAVNEIPLRSNLIDRLIAGDTCTQIHDTGVEKIEVLKLPKVKRKTGRPGNPNSLRQKIKRGEITRYEAYQKKIASEDDAL